MKMNYKKSCYIILIISFLYGLESVNAQDIGDKIEQKQEDMIPVAFKSIEKEDLLGGVSFVDVSELLKKNYGTYSLDNLEALISGYTGSIWGQSVLILVDGVPREAGDVRLVEIESISVLKGASAVALYGSTASKGGVILITTKRGTPKPLEITARLNTGINIPKRYPTYLNAAEYMTLYNEASRNDGIAERYDAEQIYNTAAGTNPFRYPDINYFNSDYLKRVYSQSDLTTEISGGNESARYYTNLGISRSDNLLKYGGAEKNNKFSFRIRSNVDMDITSWLSASASAVAIVDDSYDSRGDFWGTSSTMRPNWFNILIPIDKLDLGNENLKAIAENSNHIIDDQYLLGGLSTVQTNAFSDMLAAGYIKTKNRRFMFDVGATADLSGITEGLSFKAAYSLDYTGMYNEAFKLDYAVYEPIWSNIDGEEMISNLIKYNEDLNSTNEYIGENRYRQTISFRSQFDYKRTFSTVHNVSGSLLGWGYTVQTSNDAGHSGSEYQLGRNANLGIQTSYNYEQKYYFDFTGALAHSAKLAPGHRDAFSPVATLGWRLSKESFFLEKVTFIDDLKLSASYGSLNQDVDIAEYYMYLGYFVNNAGWYQWRDAVAGGWSAGAVQGENLGLSFIKRNELRVGIDASILDGLFNLNANYFIQDTKGLLTQGSSTIFPSYFSDFDFSFLPYLNFNKDRRSGVDYMINLNKKMGDIDISLGLTGMYYVSKALNRDEVWDEKYQYRSGKSLSTAWGYVSEGLFVDQDDIDNHAIQSFGQVQAGDIKYKDINDDGVIDSKDQIDLGLNSSPFRYGINLTLKWERFTLFALANGQRGAIGFKNSNYYWIRGDGKYSEFALDRTRIEKDGEGNWEVASMGTYPRLTTTSNSNNFQNSTFWRYKTNRFDLTRVQITYDFNSGKLSDSFLQGLSVYIKGDNLLLLSKERELMETNIGSLPQFRFYNIGVMASF